MLYSEYRRMVLVTFLIIGAVFALFFLAIDPAAAIIFVGLMFVLGLFLVTVHFSLVQDRLDDYGGRFPMPAFGLGVWGADIVDDKARQPAADGPVRTPTESADLVTRHMSMHCPKCHATLARMDAEFCDECGARLDT
jgi:hypothetical protein